ncbi:MAG: carboxypeptidase-like regulatory domain-containing protein [Ferruginibacter sp.]
MNKLILYLLFASFFLVPSLAKAQFESFKDSVVQLYGVVMTADSLKAVPSVSVTVKGTSRGTITNDQGVFSIVALKGDMVEFSSVGYKPKVVTIPKDIEGSQYSILQLMVNDTVYLAATIIKSRPSREQFERDFINTVVPDDQLEIARKNNDEGKRRILMATLPTDGKEAAGRYLTQQAAKTYYSGQIPPMNIFNPFAWNEFIQSWKRGDFKKK